VLIGQGMKLTLVGVLIDLGRFGADALDEV